MLADSTALNAAIIGIVSLITLLLRRLFTKRDSVYERMLNEAQTLRSQLNWQRSVINLMDQELWDTRNTCQTAGVTIGPRRKWPAYPEPDDDKSSRSRSKAES